MTATLSSRLGFLVTLACVAALIAPTAATASDGKGWAVKDRTSTNSKVKFGAAAKMVVNRKLQRAKAPRRSGFFATVQDLAFVPTSTSTFDEYLNMQCRSTVDGSSETVPVDCRAARNDPADPAAPAPAVGGGAAEVVDASTLAQRAASQLDLVKPTISTSPEAPVKALVGLETWLWVPAGQWRTLTESVEVGDTEVTVTARPTQTRWDMGESTVNCPNRGRAWRKGLGQSADTSCGYTYRHTSIGEPNKKYRISGLIRYEINWTCDGDCTEDGGALGTLDSAPSGAALEVSERQSVVVR